MGFLDFIKKRGVATSVRFKFVPLEVGVLQHWHLPKSDDLVIASHLCYVAHYFCIGESRHRELMLDHLAYALNGTRPFERDSDGVHFSHKAIWQQIFDALSLMERQAATQVFSASMSDPVYYRPGDVTEGRVFTEYLFDVKFPRGKPIYYLTLGAFDKLLLPLSVSMFANHNLLQVTPASAPRLAASTDQLLQAVRSDGVTIFSVKPLLQKIFATCDISV